MFISIWRAEQSVATVVQTRLVCSSMSRRHLHRLPPGIVLQVPGTYFDALNPNTKLGKAVRAAVDELNHLNSMVGGLQVHGEILS
jgi:hypothetical protein